MYKKKWETLRSWLMKHKRIEPSILESKDIKRLDLSGLSLEKLPKNFDLLTELIVLNLSNNKLSTLPLSLASLQGLKNLDLRRNAFEVLPEVLTMLNLGSLNVSSNKLSDTNILLTCESLLVCDLSFNKLSCFNESNISIMKLRTLNLSGNFFNIIPESIKKFTQLQRLDMSQNLISEIKSNISILDKLIDINLSDNKIDKIDNNFFDLDIEEADLSSNLVNKIHLRGLKKLERLSLDENPLEECTVSTDFAPILKEFSCDSCKLKKFIHFSSKHLKSLCLSSNKIKIIPESIRNYTKLHQLDIDDNNIKSLPYEMTNMLSLQTLYITKNPLNKEAKHIVKILDPDICDLNMKTGITIEKAKNDDIPQMVKLIAVLFEIEKDFEINFDKQLSGVTKLMAYDGADLLVARYKKKIIGMITMQRLISSAAGDYIGQIEDLIVHEKYRKMGVGSRLINKIRFLALDEYGYKRVQLSADMDNINALDFYTRRGFRRTNLNVYHLTK